VWQRLANLKQNLVPDILQQQAFFTSLAFQIFRNEFNYLNGKNPWQFW